MPLLYMILWSFVLVLFLSPWRLRSLNRTLFVLIVSAVILLFSQALFVNLAMSAGVNPDLALAEPTQFIGRGPAGLLALLIMPFGWLGPIIGLNLVQRWEDRQQSGV